MNFSKKKLTILSVLLIFCLDAFGPGLIHSICTSLIISQDSVFLSQDTSAFIKESSLLILYLLFPIAQLIGAPLTGDFSDVLGHKKTLSYTLLGSIFGYLLISLSIYLSSIILLYVSCFITGLFASNWAIGYAAVSNLSKTETIRAKNFSLIISIGSTSSFTALSAAPLLFLPFKDTFLSFILPFLITACLFAGNLLFMLFAFAKDAPTSKKASFSVIRGAQNIMGALCDQKFKNSCLVFFFLASSWTICFQYYPLNLVNTFQSSPLSVLRNLATVSLVWFCSNFFLQKRLAGIARPEQMLPSTLFILTLFMFSCFIQNTYFLFSLYFTLMTIFAAISWSNSLTYVSLLSSSENQGRAFGIIQSFSALAIIITTLLMNWITSFHPKSVFLLGAVYTLLAIVYLHKNTTPLFNKGV